jgi:hypothetical protein
MINYEEHLIKNVMGFKLDYTIEGTKPGFKTVLPKKAIKEKVKTNIVRNYKFFTNFNRQLLDKVVDYKRLNG